MIRDSRIEEVMKLPRDGKWATLKDALTHYKISYAILYMRIRMGKVRAVNWRGITFVELEKEK